MGWIGAGEIVVILLLALILFGPGKIPELAKLIGSGLREFRKMTTLSADELLKEEKHGEKIPEELTPSPSPDSGSGSGISTSGDETMKEDEEESYQDPYHLNDEEKEETEPEREPGS